MEDKNVPKKISDEITFGNMIIESDSNSSIENKNQENIHNINNHFVNTNSINSTSFPTSTKTKSKTKNNSKLRGDASNAIRCKNKNTLNLKNTLKSHKNKNKIEIEDSKKLSIYKKNTQSNINFNEGIKEKIRTIKSETNLSGTNEINDMIDEKEMNIEKDNIINNNINNNENNNNENINNTNSIINNEINFQYITVKNNIKEIIYHPLTSITYKEFNSILPPFEYLNDIWGSFLEKESVNNYSYNAIISIQTDIKDTMRCILIDWIISLQNKFFKKTNTLFLTINLIDRYLSKKSILRTKFQLLGVASLFIAYKYEEINMKKIDDFVNLAAGAFNKYEILEMEKNIIDLVEFNLDLPLCNDFFDLLSTVYKFDKKEYFFGYFLLEAFLLDISCCEYKQSQIALATTFIILGLRQIKRIDNKEDNNFLKYYSNEYKVNFDIWKEYDIIINCAQKIYFFFEQSEKVSYREVYKVFNNLFI